MATKQQREFLKSVLPNKFFIRKEMGEEQIYCYKVKDYLWGNPSERYVGTYDRLGEVNQVIKNLQAE